MGMMMIKYTCRSRTPNAYTGKKQQGELVSTRTHLKHSLLSFSYYLHVSLTSVSWRYFTGVCATASLFRSPGLFLVFWSRLVWFQSFQEVLFSSRWRPFRVLQLQLVLPSPSCSTGFLVLWQSFKYLSLPGGNTPERSSCTAIYHPSRKVSKLDEPDMQDTAGEVGTSS